MADLPSPFSQVVKMKLEDERESAPVPKWLETTLRSAGMLKSLDAILHSSDPKVADVMAVVERANNSVPGSRAAGTNVDKYRKGLMGAMVHYIGIKGLEANGIFMPSSTHSKVLHMLARNLEVSERHKMIDGLVNHLRYPNRHTNWFMSALLDLFGNSAPADEGQDEVMESIVGVLIERLHVHRPHPWGVVVLLLELCKKKDYVFWELPFVKASPDIERLFASLNSNINSGPQAMA